MFGIVLGALATLTSVGIVGLKIATSKAPFLIESVLSFLLVVSYAFGVAFITSQVRLPSCGRHDSLANTFNLIFVRLHFKGGPGSAIR